MKWSIERMINRKGPMLKRSLHLICKILNIFRVFFGNVVQREQYLQYRTIKNNYHDWYYSFLDGLHISSYREYLMISLNPKANSPALHTPKYIPRDIKITGITISSFAGVWM